MRKEEGRHGATAAASTPAAPTASLTANPNTINAGQSSTLSWNTTNATDVSIDGLGKVGPSGSTQVVPPQSTTYRLVAKNESGTQEATARITVNPPAAPPRRRRTPAMRSSSSKT